MGAQRRRLDAELVRRGLVPSRARAADAVDAGRVLVGGAPVINAARLVAADEAIVILPAPDEYVSRGGYKLARPADHFGRVESAVDDLFAEFGEIDARADLYYPDARLVIEYDGGNHRDRLVDDDRRQNRLINAGYAVLRFTAQDIYNRPKTIVAQVSAGVAASARRPVGARR